MRFSLLNLSANLALAALKATVGFVSGSRALVAAALYSINDVLSALIVMVSLKVGSRPDDADHRYGHGKAEFIAIGMVGVILAVGVVFILYYSLIDIIRGVSAGPHAIAVAVAVLSLVINGVLSARGLCAARMLSSPALHTSAEHLRADAVSSAAVLIGVLGATLGLHILDQLVAVFEALHILWLAGTLFGTSMKGLMDTSLPESEEDEIRETVLAVEGVLAVAQLRTRLAGSHSWADVIVGLPRSYSVREAEVVCAKVKAVLERKSHRSLRVHVGFRPIDEEAREGSLAGARAASATGAANA